jgi:hypothetical protein
MNLAYTLGSLLLLLLLQQQTQAQAQEYFKSHDCTDTSQPLEEL